MSYIVMHKNDIHVSAQNKFYAGMDYYVYDSTDGTIEQCKGRDILLLCKHGRDFKNCLHGSVRYMMNMSIITSDLGICLRDNILLVASDGFLWEVNNINSILHIVLSDCALLLRCYVDRFKRLDLTFFADYCHVEDYMRTGLATYRLLGQYKNGQAGAEIARRCV